MEVPEKEKKLFETMIDFLDAKGHCKEMLCIASLASEEYGITYQPLNLIQIRIDILYAVKMLQTNDVTHSDYHTIC